MKRGASRSWSRAALLPIATLSLLAEACREEVPATASQAQPAARKEADLLIFPRENHVGDESVNEFVARAMRICGAGEYEPFRLLWSQREEPMPRDQFEQGWQAVKAIRIAALRKARYVLDQSGGSPEGEVVYLVLAEVSLDPHHPAARQQPKREVALMLVRERNEWRVAQPPPPMREWIRDAAKEGADQGQTPAAAQSKPDS